MFYSASSSASSSAKRAIATLIPALLLAGCSSATVDQEPLTVIASATPHAEILEWIDEQDPELELNVTLVTDGPGTNQATFDGSAAANFFQHEPFLRDWEDQTGKHLVNLAPVHIEPMSMYSEQVDEASSISEGSTIVVPSSPSNLARALLLLEANGLIELDADLDPAAVSSINEASISHNPLGLKVTPVEDLIVMHSLRDDSVAAVIASSAIAMDAGYDPVDDAVITESAENNPYANILVANEETADDPRVLRLRDALVSDETAEWITEKYGNAVRPVR